MDGRRPSIWKNERTSANLANIEWVMPHKVSTSYAYNLWKEHKIASDRYGFFRHLQITIIGRFRFADISANADNLQIHIFIGRCGNISADSRGYLQIFEDIWMLWTVVSIWADILPNHSVASGLQEVQIYLQIWGPYRQIRQLSADQLWICRYADTGLFCRYHIFRYIGMDICRFYLQIKISVAR